MPRSLSLAAATLLFVTAGTLFGQTSTGSVAGRVVDASGAPIAAADVRLINEATRNSRQAATSTGGDFLFVDVQPGDYSLQIKVNGFKQLDKTGMHLAASDALSAGTLQLQVGAVSEA